MKPIYSVLCPWQGKMYHFSNPRTASKFAKYGNLESARKLNPGLKKAKLEALVPFLPSAQTYQVDYEQLLGSQDVAEAVEQIKEHFREMEQYDLKVKGARDD